MRKTSFILFIVLFPFISNAQSKKTPVKKKNMCTTYVYNLTTDKMTIRDICVYVSLTDHIDMNEYRIGKSWDRQYDNWKFSIEVIDNDKLKRDNTKASFVVYEDNSEFTQYHCIIESVDIKALIYDKAKSDWQILVLQNDEYKILSSYTGYHFTNAFNIKVKSKSSDGY
jgi:hypothetical protein